MSELEAAGVGVDQINAAWRGIKALIRAQLSFDPDVASQATAVATALLDIDDRLFLLEAARTPVSDSDLWEEDFRAIVAAIVAGHPSVVFDGGMRVNVMDAAEKLADGMAAVRLRRAAQKETG